MPVITRAPPQLSQVPLAAFYAQVSYVGACVFSEAILVEERRADTLTAYAAPPSFDIALTYERSLYDAVSARARWVGSSLKLGGTRAVGLFGRGAIVGALEIVTTRGMELSFEEGMVPGEQSTVTFKPVGDRWAVPSIDYVPPAPSTCPTELVLLPHVPVQGFGNFPTELSLLLGKSPALMQTFRLFQGQTLQKSNRGDFAVTGSITAVDDSILYTDKALCLEIQPFSGLRRDEVIRLAAANVGLNPETQVICPLMAVIAKPVLLSNASFLSWVNDFIVAENCFASFDEYGRLYVRPIERKDAPDLPDWTLDEAKGDFDFDTLEEEEPSKPPTKFYVAINQPVQGTGPGGAGLTVTTRTTQEQQDLYDPQCVKVPPSGATSHLFGDGSYRQYSAEFLMVVSRIVTEVTTTNGLEIRRVVTTSQMYNPLAYDPNFDTNPPGTSYDGAYGDKSFHRDECESLMETSQDATDTLRDVNGTILGTTRLLKSWYAPHRGGNYTTDFRAILNDTGLTPPAYVYAGATTRVQPIETYVATLKIETAFIYGPEGTLATTSEKRTEFYSADARCDIIQTTTTPDSGPPTDNSDPDTPPIDNPPPTPPPPSPPWWPSISGPIAQVGGRFTFLVDVSGAPAGVGAQSVLLAGRETTQFPPVHGLGGGSSIGNTTVGDGCFIDPANDISQGYASITFHGTDPRDGNPSILIYVSYQLTASGDVHRFSNNLIFNPWADVPPGGSL